MMHMFGSGLHLRNEDLLQSIAHVATPEGVSFNSEGEFEIWAESNDIAGAFAHYMSAMVALLNWEAIEVNRMSTPPA